MIGWSDSATIIPWNVYVMNGRKQILEEQYEGMKMWVEVMGKHIEDGLWDVDYIQFCDWVALDGPNNAMNRNHVYGGTENTFVCTTYYYYSLTLTSKAAKVLGKNEDFEKYNDLALKTLNRIREEYFSPRGRCSVQTQTALSLSIVHGLYPEGTIQSSSGSLCKLLMDRNYHLCTGFIGTQILCKALTMAGDNDTAVNVFLKKDFPGWLYPVTMGATTMWERWGALQPNGKVSPDGMNSFNHYAYGSICEWIYCDVCGLNPVEESPGFKRVILRPHTDDKLENAKAIHDSPMCYRSYLWSSVIEFLLHEKLFFILSLLHSFHFCNGKFHFRNGNFRLPDFVFHILKHYLLDYYQLLNISAVNTTFFAL